MTSPHKSLRVRSQIIRVLPVKSFVEEYFDSDQVDDGVLAEFQE